MSEIDSSVRPSVLDYKLRSITAPKYKFVRIPMNNHASASVNVTATSTELLEWKLPTQVYNLARSYISYNLEIPAEANFYHMSFEDTFDIAQSATFGSAGGVDLVNIQHLQNYTKIARKIDTSVEDYTGNGDMSQLYRCDSLKTANKLPFAYGGAGVYDGADNYIEPKYTTQTAAVNQAMNRYRQFPLGAISGTLFAVDRDFYSPVEQYLRITAGVGNKIAITTKVPATPDTPAQAGDTKAPKDVKINQCYLYLAVEQNIAVVQGLMSKYASGQLSFRIPYTTGFKNVGGGASTATNIQIQISQQYGKRLKRILHTVWYPVESGATAYDCSNWDGSKIETYQTFLDSLPLQDRILSCKRPAGAFINSDDWLENKKFLDKRSCIMSKDMYALNWFHIDQFYEPHDKKDSLPPDVNLDEGLVMDTPKSWTISTTSGPTANLVHYTWVEFSRDIEVTTAGPVFK